MDDGLRALEECEGPWSWLHANAYRLPSRQARREGAVGAAGMSVASGLVGGVGLVLDPTKLRPIHTPAAQPAGRSAA